MINYIHKFILLAGLVIFSRTGIAQSSIEEEVNEQLWKPFKQAWENRDWKAYNNLHTDDILRITKNWIKQGKAYKDHNRERYSEPSEVVRNIDFWMEQRTYSDDVGFETGYFKITTLHKSGDKDVNVGRFQVVLRKEQGLWKIAQDWDSDTINGVKLSEKDFERHQPLKLD